MASLRLAIIPPRATFSLHSKQLQHLRLPHIRHASHTTPPPKPRVLEKPDKFRPPSHPSRIRSKPRYTYGPDLTQQQKTKRYPHMMPAEGTFMHWFLTQRTIHAAITMSILVTLVVAIWFSDFVHSTPYRDLLPPNSMFFAHPISFVGRWAEVYSMHVAYVSGETYERRKLKVDDAKKRSEYRKAHGMASPDGGNGWFGDWFSTVEPETAAAESLQSTHVNADGASSESEDSYLDFEGKPQSAKKKWLGIW